MSAAFQALADQVAANTDAVNKAVASMALLTAGKEDPAALAALTSQVKASTDALSAAVAAASPPAA